ncbi:MAG: hypothetical protein ABW060_17305 [Solirubrobacteraceae bacterium]
MGRFQRAHDPDRSGQLLLDDGEPAGLLFWSHDFADRDGTGWFLALLEPDGEEGDAPPVRLDVSGDVDLLAADEVLGRGDWIARAETLELVTAAAALDAAELALADALG